MSILDCLKNLCYDVVKVISWVGVVDIICAVCNEGRAPIKWIYHLVCITINCFESFSKLLYQQTIWIFLYYSYFYRLNFILGAEFFKLRYNSHKVNWRSIMISMKILYFSILIHKWKSPLFDVFSMKNIQDFFMCIYFAFLYFFLFLLDYSCLLLLLFSYLLLLFLC
mgnify:CR=1 FL=1